MRGPRNSQDYNALSKQERAFARSYAEHGNVARAALAANYPPRIALSAGMALFAKVGVCQEIHAQLMSDEDKAEFADRWLRPIEADVPLFDRIQAVRERIALDARDGLPLPSEIQFLRKPLSRRAAARAARAIMET